MLHVLVQQITWSPDISMHDTKRCWKCSLFGQTIIYMSGFIMFYLLRALYSFWGHFFDDAFPPNADAEEVAASLSQAGLVFWKISKGHPLNAGRGWRYCVFCWQLLMDNFCEEQARWWKLGEMELRSTSRWDACGHTAWRKMTELQ